MNRFCMDAIPLFLNAVDHHQQQQQQQSVGDSEISFSEWSKGGTWYGREVKIAKMREKIEWNGMEE